MRSIAAAAWQDPGEIWCYSLNGWVPVTMKGGLVSLCDELEKDRGIGLDFADIARPSRMVWLLALGFLSHLHAR
jgi:hypothetical protein